MLPGKKNAWEGNKSILKTELRTKNMPGRVTNVFLFSIPDFGGSQNRMSAKF